jgi:hypothetical protein
MTGPILVAGSMAILFLWFGLKMLLNPNSFQEIPLDWYRRNEGSFLAQLFQWHHHAIKNGWSPIATRIFSVIPLMGAIVCIAAVVQMVLKK